MQLTEERKQYIDNLSYEELLSHWRFAPIGDPWFQGETGKYWAKLMQQKRKAIENAEHVRISKEIGWDK